MVNLAQARRHFRDRVAEEGVEFWGEADVLRYLNLAQDFIASVTRGVSEEVTEQVGVGQSSFPLPARTLNAHQLSGYDADRGEAMGTISVADANLISPSWRRMRGHYPKWFILDIDNREAHVSPIPTRPVNVSLRVSVLPDPVSVDSDPLFNGQDVMDKYLNALINTAAVYAYLKERFDQEAERMYGFVVRELQDLGANPNSIPPFAEVARGDNSG